MIASPQKKSLTARMTWSVGWIALVTLVVIPLLLFVAHAAVAAVRATLSKKRSASAVLTWTGMFKAYFKHPMAQKAPTDAPSAADPSIPVTRFNATRERTLRSA